MTRDDVIAMAREAAARHGHTLKAVPEQATVEFITELVAMATSAEREACAKACDTQQQTNLDWGDEQRADTARTCAATIRARPTGHKES